MRREASGPRVVALHGFGGAGEDFELLAATCPSLDLLAPDLVGHGTCPPPEGLEPYRMDACVARLREALPVDRPWTLLGYSMGARTGLHLALTRPPGLRGVVLVGGTAGVEADDARAERAVWDEQMAQEVLAQGTAAFAEGWARLPLIATQARIPSPWRERLRARRRQASARGLAGSLRGMGAGVMPAVWHRLEALDLPVLVVVGEDDPRYRRLARRLVASLPQARAVVLGGAGHAAHLEAPEAFGRVLDDFLDRRNAAGDFGPGV